MADCPKSPVDVLDFLLGCAQAHLVGRPGGIPATILVGASGVSIPYGCCDLLVVEALGPIERDPDVGPGIVTGCEPCDLTMQITYRVTVKRCVPAFDTTRTDGAPPPVAERNSMAINLVESAWLLWQALRCCINEVGFCRCGNVTVANTSLQDGCSQFWTDVVWEHTPCC